MKDEINGSGYGGEGRRLVRGNWSTKKGERRRTMPVRREELAALRVGGSGISADAPFGLVHVYFVLSLWPACDRSPLERYAYDIALNRVLERITKHGASAPTFASEVEVYAYAKRVRTTAMIDAHRHMGVVDRSRQALAPEAGARMNLKPIDLPPGVADESAEWEQERAEQHEWLVARLGADAAELIERVHLDDETVAEIARESLEAESTIRSRLLRAEAKLRACLEAEHGLRVRCSNN